MGLRLQRTASFVALVAAVLILIADSPAPECSSYEGIDVQYTYETDCPQSNPSGVVRFQVSAADVPDVAKTGALLIEQASAAGLMLKGADVLWSHLDCLGDEEGGLAQARGFRFTMAADPDSPATRTSRPIGAGYDCEFWDGELDEDQTLACKQYVPEGEWQSCTFRLTHVD